MTPSDLIEKFGDREIAVMDSDGILHYLDADATVLTLYDEDTDTAVIAVSV